MPLTDDQRQAIRDEEMFRDEVRRELSALGGKKAPPGVLERISAFFESKTGFWLLTTVLAGVTATGYTELRNFLNRKDIAQQQAAERSRTDMETVLKLGPMLTAKDTAQIGMAIILLKSLLDNGGVDDRIGKPVTKLFEDTLAKGQSSDATPAERYASNAIASLVDSTRIDAIRRPDTVDASAAPAAAAPSPLVQALDKSDLPARVYLQIGRETDRPVASEAQKALREAGLIVPGIELVGGQRAPARNDLRYCADRVDAAVLARVRSAVDSAIQPAPAAIALPANLCSKVRHNHFEVWYAVQPA